MFEKFLNHKKLFIGIVCAVLVIAAAVLIAVYSSNNGGEDPTMPNDGTSQTTAPTDGTDSHQHVYTEEVVPATCKQGGYTLHVCACGDQYKTDETDPLTHEYGEWAVIQEPTTEEEGKRAKTCIYCTESVFEPIPKIEHEHTYAEEVVAPTCTAGGYTNFVCSVCGHSFVGDLTAVAAHNWTEWTVTVAATTSAPGEKAHSCTVCGTTEYVAIPKLTEHVHNYTATTVVAPTCTENGHTVFACECGRSYNNLLTEALGHSYGDWVVTVEATKTSTGLRHRSCTRCGYVYEEVTPMLDPVTGEAYVHYIDPRIKSELVAGGAMSYFCDELERNVSFNDTRTWGTPPSIWILEDGSFRIVYFQKDGTKTEVVLEPHPTYSVQGRILDDGTFTSFFLGDFRD